MFCIDVDGEFLKQAEELAERYAERTASCGKYRSRSLVIRKESYMSIALYVYMLCSEGDLKKLISVDIKNGYPHYTNIYRETFRDILNMKYYEVLLDLRDNGLIDINEHYNYMTRYDWMTSKDKDKKTFPKSYRISAAFMTAFEQRLKSFTNKTVRVNAPLHLQRMIDRSEKNIEKAIADAEKKTTDEFKQQFKNIYHKSVKSRIETSNLFKKYSKASEEKEEQKNESGDLASSNTQRDPVCCW